MNEETAPNKRKIEFSKIIIFVSSIVNFAVIVFTAIMVWRTNDNTPLLYLIPSVAAEVSASNAFYFSKAKTENKLKLMKAYGIQPEPQNFND
jgi:hypothetical protein